MIQKSIHEIQGFIAQEILERFREIKHMGGAFAQPEGYAQNNRNKNRFDKNTFRLQFQILSPVFMLKYDSLATEIKVLGIFRPTFLAAA